MELFISFTYEKCEVKDSIQFLPAGLDELAKSLPVDDPYINQSLDEAIIGLDDNKDDYLLTSIEKLNSTISIFPINSFHNNLYGSQCLEDEYSEAVKNLGMVDLSEDTMIFIIKRMSLYWQQLFRFSLTSDGLETSHYYSMPGLTFDAALKLANKPLELIIDETIYGMMENSLWVEWVLLENVTPKPTTHIWQNWIIRKKCCIICILMR